MIPLQSVPILPLSAPDQSTSKTSDIAEIGENFANTLSNMVQQVGNHEQSANNAIQQLHAGGEINLHETMLSIEKADIAMRYMVQVRNKALEAYQEIMRLQV
jgi:flagellar hook-basal body complex protein FliE